jgi:hypothetical protein
MKKLDLDELAEIAKDPLNSCEDPCDGLESFGAHMLDLIALCQAERDYRVALEEHFKAIQWNRLRGCNDEAVRITQEALVDAGGEP